MKTRKTPPIDDRITFLMHRIEAKMELICNPMFRHLDVALHTSRMLVILMEVETARVGDLVTRMVLPQSTISHQLRALEKRKLIRRTQAVADSRSVIVELTARGKAVAEQCNQLSAEVYEAMVAGLSQPELERLRVQMRHMFDGLEKLSARKNADRPAPGAKRRRAASA
jgi:DNA-binding MarR family transcriptional regulator